jgi:energy-converting hydrogenase Eha subunit A
MLILGIGATLFALSQIYFDIKVCLIAALTFSIAGYLALKFGSLNKKEKVKKGKKYLLSPIFTFIAGGGPAIVFYAFGEINIVPFIIGIVLAIGSSLFTFITIEYLKNIC